MQRDRHPRRDAGPAGLHGPSQSLEGQDTSSLNVHLLREYASVQHLPEGPVHPDDKAIEATDLADFRRLKRTRLAELGVRSLWSEQAIPVRESMEWRTIEEENDRDIETLLLG